MRSLPVTAVIGIGALAVVAFLLAAPGPPNADAAAETKSAGQGSVMVTLIRSGGVSGIVSRMSLNSAELAPEKAGRLRELLDKCGFFQLPAKIGTPQPDHYQYRLAVEADGRRHEVTAIGPSMPDGLRELIQWIIAEGSAKRDKPPRAS